MIYKAKVIRILDCDESCPYFKETPVYDNSPDIRCIHPDNIFGGKEIPQYETLEKDGYTHIGKDLSGIIPDWCPLENES